MIEARTPNAVTETTENTTKMETPTTITTSMILLDLENGIDRPGIKEKYNLEGWELTEMFKHPVLKGKKASRKRRMSFNFVDDTPTEAVTTTQTDLVESIEEVTTDAHLEQEADDRDQFETAMEAEQKEDTFSDGFDEE